MNGELKMKMKKIAWVVLFLFASMSLSAQEWGGVRVKELSVGISGETVEVGFEVEVLPKTARRGETVIYAPLITDGTNRVSLTPVIIQGRQASLAWMRHEWAAGLKAGFGYAVYVSNKETVDYRSVVPFQSWMQDSRIEVEWVRAGCCDSRSEVQTLARNILPPPEFLTEPEPEPRSEPEPEPTVAELLESTFPFVLPASEFVSENYLYDDERDNGLTVYYKVNRYDIEPDYADNRQTLINLTAAIEAIRKTEGIDVKQVVVGGFTSPEGSFALNDRLAWERAVSVKEHILKSTGMRDEQVMLFNGSADWHGLKLEVEKDPLVPSRREVLHIIDCRSPEDTEKLVETQNQLRNLDNGVPYRYLRENIFPKLRNGAFIRVYYEEEK